MYIINTWQTYLGIYLVAIIIFNQFYRLAVKNALKNGAATILLQSIATIYVLFFIPFFEFKFSSDIKVYLLIILASIFYAINDRLQTTTRKNLPVSEYTILSQSSRIFLFLYGLFLFHEPFVLGRALGLILVVVANITLTYNNGKLVINKYVWLTLLSTLIFATAISIDIGLSGQFNLPIYIAITLTLPALLISLTEKLNLKDILNEFKPSVRKHYILTGITWGTAILASLKAYQLGGITIQSPIRGSVVFINVIIAYLFFGEKKNFKKKVIAAILILIGVYITTL